MSSVQATSVSASSSRGFGRSSGRRRSTLTPRARKCSLGSCSSLFPFVLSAVFFMGAISTGQEWLIGGSLVTGPGLLIMAFIYLSISSDTNGDEQT